MHGKHTLAVEVTNVSPLGLWMLIQEVEYYLPYTEFPWFKQATIEQVIQVEMPVDGHLYWSLLDIDLAVESITSPEKYPLVS
jgi:hypothetical protein